MKRSVLAVAVVVAAAMPARADACGVTDFGMLVHDLDLKGKLEPMSTPFASAGVGYSTEGLGGSLHVGWAWGEKQHGGLFPGTRLRRVLIGVRTPFDGGGGEAPAMSLAHGMVTPEPAAHGRTEMSLTYGWYDNTLFDLGLDVGVAGTRDRVGPTAALTFGSHGIDLRFTAGVQVGNETRFAGAAELVFDVMALAGRI